MEVERPVTWKKLAEYLANPDKFDCGIAISNSSVNRKSSEDVQRYFCPPPRVNLFGDGWKKLFGNTEKTSKSAAGKPSSSRASKKPRQPKLRFTIGIDELPSLEDHPLNLSSEKKQTVDNMLYVPDNAEKANVSLKVNMFRRANEEAESFLSHPMKIIGKPSKKKKNRLASEVGIRSGSTVALYVAASDQAPAQYFQVENEGYQPSQDNWSSFFIYNVLENGDLDKSLSKKKKNYINYGAIVKLVDRVTGTGLPKMRILHVENGIVKLDQSEDQEMPVCQLDKCAFQVLDHPDNYLSIVSNKIIQAGATVVDESSLEIEDTAAWTIMPTDKTEYRFYEAMGPATGPVTPVPTIIDIKPNKHVETGNTMIEFIGADFHKDLTIWIGLYDLNQHSQSSERITCFQPTLYAVSSPPESDMFPVADDEVSLPITITRNDGVVYGTPYYFQYNIKDGRGWPAVVDPRTEFANSKRLRRL
uniref:BTD domain-containing protein n=1 Tax=Panagrellus redivivus TaxID=6233 RepID=A0A7E4V6X5_PANRE